MEVEGRDFLYTPPMKTVRFGGSVAETLDKLRQVSGARESIHTDMSPHPKVNGQNQV